MTDEIEQSRHAANQLIDARFAEILDIAEGETRQVRLADQLNDEAKEAEADKVMANFGKDSHLAQQVDHASSLIKAGMAAGMSLGEMDALRSSLDSPEAEKVVEQILERSAQRFSNYQSAMDKKFAALAGGDDDDGVLDEFEHDGLDHQPYEVDGFQDEQNEPDDNAPFLFSSADLLKALSDAKSQEEQEALLTEVMALRTPEVNDDAEDLRLENEILRLQTSHPNGSAALEALSRTSTLSEQAAILEAYVSTKGQSLQPEPVDMNSPGRDLRMGLQTALASGQMNDEIADVILDNR